MSERITATVPQFCELSGMGKTKVFRLLKDGTLQSIKIGQSRLVVLESYWRIIEEQKHYPWMTNISGTTVSVRVKPSVGDGKADGKI